ncbi:MAG TPA: sigma-70 family RNA polymerase sigma factor [Opitutales bacterium]|nr:sigma-70 family RNA polymerase sigma factor [Opitutales bacterium]
MDDRALLESYLTHRSQAAFTELVNRHLPLVYSTAVRITRQPALAEDVAQNVFIQLAHRAPTLRDGNALPGWLYRITCHTAYNALRTEKRRRHNETAAMQLSEIFQNSHAAWEHIAPLLDEGMAQLDEAEQNLVVERFFAGRSLRDIGASLGLSDDAAQKRVHRALEKLREYFSKNGVAVPALVLVPMLSQHAIHPAPTYLAGKISAAAQVAAAAGGSLALLKFLIFMSQTKIKIGLAIIVLVALISVLELHPWADNQATQEKPKANTTVVAASRPSANPVELLAKPTTATASTTTKPIAATASVPASTTLAGPAATQMDAAAIIAPHEEVMKALVASLLDEINKGSEDNPFTSPKNMKDWANTTAANLNPNQVVKLEAIHAFSDGSVMAMIKHPDRNVLLTESAFQLPDGQWCRVYAFVDGHVESATSPNNDFTAWEAEHITAEQP